MMNMKGNHINLETGEYELYPLDEQMHLKPRIDYETGEPITPLYVKGGRTKFMVPKVYVEEPPKVKVEPVKVREPSSCCLVKAMANNEKVIRLKEEIILGYNKTSHILFLIPSLFFFFKLTSCFIVIAEIILHFYAHKKNFKNTNPYVYYRTPLHLVSSQFCSICRTQTEMEKVSKIQKERLNHRNRFRIKFTLQNVTKSLG